MFENSPTVTSFYTIAQERNANKMFTFSKSRTTGGRNNVRRSSTSTLKTSWVVNRAVNETPYLCSMARLTQSMWNVVTLGFLALAIYLHIFSYFVSSSIDQSEALALVTCQSVIASSDNLAFSASTLDTVQAVIRAVNQQLMGQLNGTISNVLGEASSYVAILSDSYSTLALSMTSSALQSAQNSTNTIHDWVNHTISAAVSQTSKEIQNVTLAVERLESALESSSVLFSNIDMGSIKDLNLNNISSISVPLDVNSKLKSANGSDFDFESLAKNAAANLETISQNLTESLTTFQSVISNSTTLNILLSPPPGTSSCLSTDFIKNSYAALKTNVSQQDSGALAAFLVLTVVMIFPSIVYQYYNWRYLQDLGKILETPGNCQDAVEIIELAKSPLLGRIQTVLKTYFISSEKKKVLANWFIVYTFSDSHVRVLLISGLSFLAFLFQCSMMKSVVNSSASNLTLSFNSASSVNATTWIRDVNTAIQQMASDMMSNSTSILSATLNQVDGVLADYQAGLASHLQSSLQPLDLTLVNQGLLPTAVPMSSLTIIDIAYPQLNQSALAISANDANFYSGTPQILGLNGLISTIKYVSNLSLALSLTLFCGWLCMAIGAGIYAFIKGKK